MAKTPDECMDRFKAAQTPEEALACLDEALALDAGFIPALGSKGTLLGQLGKHDEALACFDQVAEKLPRMGAAHYSRGLHLQALGRLDEAVDAYSKAIEVEPGEADAYINRGRLLDERGEAEEAIADYDAALKLTPDDAVAWSNRGNSLRALERAEEALESYDRALAADPDSVPAQLGRSTVLMMLGRIEEANEARPVDTPADPGVVLEKRRDLESGGSLVLRYYPGAHSNPELLDQLADDLLQYASGLESVGDGLADGVRIQYLWSVLTVRDRDGERVLCEPSFGSNPMEQIDYHVSFSLQTAFMISLLHEMVGVPPSDCTFLDAVALSPRVLIEKEIAMHRLHETDERGFSGWVAGPETLDEVAELLEGKHALFLPSAALTGIRESLLKVLSLPAGYRVAFDGDTVTSVIDADGKERFQAPDA